jgi:rod shape-determining protein MreC
MFSKKMVMIVGVIILIAANIIILSASSRSYSPYYEPGRIAITLIAPFQEIVTRSIRFVRNIWNYYFDLVAAAKENVIYKKALSQAVEKNNQYKELKLSNTRLRKMLNFQETITKRAIAAEVIGKDPSPWFKTIIIDKGKDDRVERGMAVVIPEGVVGQVIDVSSYYSKVLLIIDHNSSVDALLQRTRSRGIIKGGASGRCFFKYVLRKHDVEVGDRVVSSGLDDVFPKGLAIGHVYSITKPAAGIFQEITVTPYVNFEKLEEVLLVLKPLKQKVVSEQ